MDPTKQDPRKQKSTNELFVQFKLTEIRVRYSAVLNQLDSILQARSANEGPILLNPRLRFLKLRAEGLAPASRVRGASE
jgi:hypothetical protein